MQAANPTGVAWGPAALTVFLPRMRPCAFYRHSMPDVTLVCSERPYGQSLQVTAFHKGAPSFVSVARTHSE
jgi:hypothetical protein